MTDTIDIERIESSIGLSGATPDMDAPFKNSRQNRLTDAVEAMASRFFKSIDNEYFNNKRLFIGYFHLVDEMHCETRQSLLEAARWLCDHEDSNCIYLEEPREVTYRRIECPDGNEGRYFQRSVLLSSLVDGNMLVEDAIIQDGVVESYSYNVMGPVYLAELV